MSGQENARVGRARRRVRAAGGAVPEQTFALLGQGRSLVQELLQQATGLSS